MIALVLALASELPPSRYSRAEFEFVGPLERVRITLGERASTEVQLDLVAGERRLMTVPLPEDRSVGEPRAVELPEREGSAQWLGWSRAGDAERARVWDALVPALKSRPRVEALERSLAGRVPASALLALFSSTALALALRKRPMMALALSAVASAGCFAWLQSPPPIRPPTQVWEVDGESGQALRVLVAWERSSEHLDAPLLLRTSPPDAVVRAELGEGGRVSLHAPGASIEWTTATLDFAGEYVSSRPWWRYDELEGYRSVWTRTSDGQWLDHGAWNDSRTPLPAGRGGMPPGRFNPGLPQGLRILIARVDVREPGRAADTWLRWIGARAPFPREDAAVGR